MTSTPPLFTDTLQVAVIVRDLEEQTARYESDYGIGPWTFLDFGPDTVEEMVIDDEPAAYAMRIAVANLGRLQIELIEPLDEVSIYARHLAEHGPGLHHVALAVENFEDAERALRDKGHHILMGGRREGITYSYFSTEQALGFIVELYSTPPPGLPDVGPAPSGG